jgi:hypothetical protein
MLRHFPVQSGTTHDSGATVVPRCCAAGGAAAPPYLIRHYG